MAKKSSGAGSPGFSRSSRRRACPRWREQYDRVRRWHIRLRKSQPDDRRRVDDFYAFFVCCFHLKDWLKGDKTLDSGVGDRAETLISKPSMRICADIANGSKHLVLNRRVRFAADTHLEAVPASFQDDAFQADAFQVGAVVIVAVGQTWGALRVADQCVQYWDKFLAQEGLTKGTRSAPPSPRRPGIKCRKAR